MRVGEWIVRNERDEEVQRGPLESESMGAALLGDYAFAANEQGNAPLLGIGYSIEAVVAGERACPFCAFIVPEDVEQRDVGKAEVAHMNEAHRDVVDERLIAAGFVKEGHEWVDRLVTP